MAVHKGVLVLSAILSLIGFGWVLNFLLDLKKKKQCTGVDPKTQKTVEAVAIIGIIAGIVVVLGVAAPAGYGALKSYRGQ